MLCFTSTPGIARSVSAAVISPCCAWKHFIQETIFRCIVKFTNEEAKRRGDEEFRPSVDKLESFIALQYGLNLYGKNHLVYFL